MRADDDHTLVTAIVTQGDEAAFRTLFRRHSPSLYALARRLMGGSTADAEDAVQETWIRACRRFASFRWDSALKTWLAAILVNRCRELRRQVISNREAPPLNQPGIDPADGALRVDLERAIAELPDGYRNVVVLHDIEGYTHEDIAKLLDIDAGTSKSQLFRARRALRVALSVVRNDDTHAAHGERP
jgi:RNA polymerase sigma-70 factor (ECF subfamily)